MNAYEAILAAADHIERFPQSYNFNQGQVIRNNDFSPAQRGAWGDGGYPACMLAKIGEFAGMQMGYDHSHVARNLLGLSAMDFYVKIRAASPPYAADTIVDRAVQDVKTIPNAMREVAKEFAPIPQSVLDIFDVKGIEKAMAVLP